MSARHRARKRALAAQREREDERERLVTGRGGESCAGVHVRPSEYYLSSGTELSFVSAERVSANVNRHDLADEMRSAVRRRT